MATKSPFPSPSTPFINTNGTISRVWLELILSIFNRSGGADGIDLTALKLLVQQLQALLKAQSADISDIDAQIAESGQGAVVGELKSMFDALAAHVDAQVAIAISSAMQRDERADIDSFVAQAAASHGVRDERGEGGDAGATGVLAGRIADLEARLDEGLPQAPADATSNLGTMSTQNANAVAITGGSIDGATVGATTPATGSFTTLRTSGNVGLGVAPGAGYAQRVSLPITGNVSSQGVQVDGQIQSDVTTGAAMFRTAPTVVAASFTLAGLFHFAATQGAIGAGATVSVQYGFYAGSLSGAAANYGFYGNVPAGSTTWNLYMNSTAKNYLAGVTLFGTLVDNGVDRVQVNGSVSMVGHRNTGFLVNPIRTITATTTAAATDYTVKANAASGAIVYTLPAAASNAGRMMKLKKIDSTTNTVTLKGNASELIDAGNTYVLSAQWAAVEVQCDGTNWAVL